MPLLQIEILKGRTVEQKRAMVKEVTEAVVRNLNCKPEVVKIIIREIEREHLADAGVLHCDK